MGITRKITVSPEFYNYINNVREGMRQSMDGKIVGGRVSFPEASKFIALTNRAPVIVQRTTRKKNMGRFLQI